MADLNALRAGTTAAATKALDAGLIDKTQFSRMTDGTVSLADVTLAKQLVRNSVGSDDPKAGIAQELHTAVTGQNQAQGSLASIGEAIKDMPVIQKQTLQNIR